MTTSCDLVAQCVAFGEPLGALAEHVATCERCQRMVAMPGLLARTRQDVDPGMGFSARMTVGAKHLVQVRHRRRVATALAGTVIAAGLAVYVMARSPSEPIAAGPPPQPVETRPAGEPKLDNQPGADNGFDPDVAQLVHYANTDRNRRLSAKWTRIEKPLAPYRKLLDSPLFEGATP
jgi:hypothetical protein